MSEGCGDGGLEPFSSGCGPKEDDGGDSRNLDDGGDSRNLVLVYSRTKRRAIDDLYFSSTCIKSNGKQTERLEAPRKMKK